MALEPDSFLKDDYKYRIDYLTSHLGRMWTRFNFFVTLEAALLGGRVLLVGDKPTPMVGVAGVILSVVWYLMGAQDRFLADFYRWQVMEAAGRLGDALDREGESQTNEIAAAQQAVMDYVGRVEDDLIDRYRAWRNQKIKGSLSFVLERASSWRSKRFSTTHLAAWIPLAALVLWFMFLLYQIR